MNVIIRHAPRGVRIFIRICRWKNHIISDRADSHTGRELEGKLSIHDIHKIVVLAPALVKGSELMLKAHEPRAVNLYGKGIAPAAANIKAILTLILERAIAKAVHIILTTKKYNNKVKIYIDYSLFLFYHISIELSTVRQKYNELIYKRRIILWKTKRKS